MANEKYATGKGKPQGIRIGRVVGHVDPKGMGGLLVTIEGQSGTEYGSETGSILVKYAPPFFGQTNVGFNGINTGNDLAYNDTQKSYGMSFIPPDVGVRVLCVFDNESNDGFWIGCIPDDFMNHMVPGIAASTNVDQSPQQQTDYGSGQALPVAEWNKELDENKNRGNDYDGYKRPVHPLAGFMLESGLLQDFVRGPSTSTMRRASVSNVYGISTPGPIDKRPGTKKARRGTGDFPTEPQFVSRLGGTTFVMDDGDDRFVRKTPATDGPAEYADTKNGESGDVRIPLGECFRVRTRTGHQILLHNSEDLIYIGNGRGTTWIEMSSDGKIDIYAQDSISVHTQQDFNFRADRDVNIEAGRNVNIKAAGTTAGDRTGEIHLETQSNLKEFVGKDRIVKVTGEDNLTVTTDLKIAVNGTQEITVAADSKIIAANINSTARQETFITSGVNSNFLAGGKHIEQATKIEMNCDPASPADAPSGAVTDIEALSTFDIPTTDNELEFATTGYQSEESITSIMKRIPAHEPWLDHENRDPLAAKPDKTDRESSGE